jgi:hypothetical protein
LVAEAVPAAQPTAVEEPPAGPKVTAVISAYNQAPALHRCLHALESTTPREILEVIVMDNGSQDDTAALEGEFPNVTFLRLPKYFGRTKALNIASRTAHADLLFYLLPEIEVQPDTVARLAERMETDAEASAACPLVVDPDGEQEPVFFRMPDRKALYRACTIDTGLVAVPVDETAESQAVEYARFAAFMVTKYFVRGLNYLDERFGERWADLEVSWQIGRSGKRIVALPSAKVVLRQEEGEVVRSSSARAVIASDCGVGAAAFVAKHEGFMAGLLFRMRMVLSALGRVLTLREPGYNFSLISSLLSGQKVDGTQPVIL